MEPGTIALIVTALLSVAAVVGFLPKLIKVVGKLKESVDVATATLSALSDGKVTAEEVGKIKVEIEEAKVAWKS